VQTVGYLIAPLLSLVPRGSRLGARLLRHRSQTIKRVRSLHLSTASGAMRNDLVLHLSAEATNGGMRGGSQGLR